MHELVHLLMKLVVVYLIIHETIRLLITHPLYGTTSSIVVVNNLLRTQTSRIF
jgi:hypothetical protein